MNLNDTHRAIKRHRRRRRIGRGPGSGHGKTCSRGYNGEGSRAGNSHHPTFEGGRMPLFRRVPKRGFNNRWGLVVAIVNVGDLERAFDDGDEVTPDTLRARNLANTRFDLLKVLGNGELKKKLKVSAHRFSSSALEKIGGAGGEAVVLPGKAPLVKQRAKPSS